MTIDLIAACVGVVLSLLMKYSPVFSDWWEKQKYKRELLVLVFMVTPFVIYGLSCGGLDFTHIPCPTDAFRSFRFYYVAIKTGLFAFGASQLTFAGIKRVSP